MNNNDDDERASKMPLFDENGNLILPDKSWMEKKYEHPVGLKSIHIPPWVVRSGGQSDSGLWVHMGYEAGKDGPGSNQRRRNLISIYEAELRVEDPSNQNYVDSFGGSGSDKRYKRILSYLTKQILSKQYDERMTKPVSKWKSDMDWLKKYVGFRHLYSDD